MNEDIEVELRTALQRVAAPEGFSERVMARLPSESAAPTWWRLAVAAVVLCALLVGTAQYRRQQQQAEALKTERQVVFALTLAAEKLERVNYRLQRAAPEVNLNRKRGNHYDE